MVEMPIFILILIIVLAAGMGGFLLLSIVGGLWSKDDTIPPIDYKRLEELEVENRKLREHNELLTDKMSYHFSQHCEVSRNLDRVNNDKKILEERLAGIEDERAADRDTILKLRSSLGELREEHQKLEKEYRILQVDYMRAKQRLNAVYGSLAFKSTCHCECAERKWLTKQLQKEYSKNGD